MSDTGDDVIEVNGDSAYSRAKLQQLRASAPFVRTLVTTFKHKMTKEQWKKLNMLSELLESENMSSAMFARCMESKLTNIETMINKLKSKYEPLLHPTEVIVIDDEQPSTSTSAWRNANEANKGKTQEASTCATATSSTDAKTNAFNEISTAVKETIPLNFGSIASQKCRANPPAPSPELTTVQDDLLERRSTAATIVDREPERLVAAEISAPTPDFERRSNPPKPTKPNLGLEPSLAARFPDIDSTIGSRRVDYVRISPRNTQTQLATLPKSTVFVRRPTVVPVPTADAETQRRSNPPAHAALEEASKKLAALTATPETTPVSPSDCTDPRGRRGSYATQIPPKASVSPIQSSAKGPTTSWPRKENIPVKKFPLPQSIPVFGSPSGSSAKSTTHTSPPTTKSIRVIGSAANINNNREHNVNLNMPNALHGSINLNYLSPGNVDGIANGFNNAQEALSTRRYGNLNGAGSRDPRRAKWGQSNGPLQQQQPQQHPTGSQYSPQGGGQRRGDPSGWQTYHNPGNYNSYNPGGGNNNNSNPGWNNNNNNNTHFINGCPNFNYNNRLMFNRATSLGGGESNAPQGPGNNNINGPPYSGAPRTYREHLAAKAKQQEMQRQLGAAEKQRQIEAAEKQRQIEAAEKQRQLDAAAAEKKRKLQEAEKLLDDGQAVAAPSRSESDNVPLDTSNRNVVLTGTTNKKLDFKIPKKASLEKVSRRNDVRVQNSYKTNTCEESIDVVNNNSEEQSSSKSNKTNKSSKCHKVAKTVHFDKEKSDSAEKVPKSDKTVDKENADKSKKVVRVDKADSDKTDNSDAKHGSCSAAKKNKSENKKDEDVDETPNKPETSENEKTKHSSKDKSPAEKSNSSENKEKKKSMADNTDNVENEPPSVVETHEQQSANKKSEVESADSQQMSANALASDAINTTKSPLKEMPELKRILKRRKSMMPTASKALVDKLELFGGVSLNYEDVVDHRREQQQLNANDEVAAEKIKVAQSSQQRVNRNLAIMFQKTSDNCSISTQNILAGKRRSQLNEPAAKTAVENLFPPPPKKRSRRSELERLNDDIAQMYYANDVIRATGRRACSAQRCGSSTTPTKKLRVRVARCAQLQQLLKCTKTANMPTANIKASAKRLIARHKSEIAKLNKKKQSPKSKTNPKVRIRPISNNAKTEPPEQANSQPVTASDMPPTRPDEEQLLVINECKLEQNEYLQSSPQAERVKGATIPPAEAESDSDVDVEVKLDVDDTSSPKLEVSIAISATPIPRELLANESDAEEDPLSAAGELIRNVEQEEVAQQPEPEKEVEQPQQVEQQVEQQAQVAIEQADEEMSESQPDGNQDLDQQHTSEQNIEQQQVLDVDVDMGVEQKMHVEEQKENELEPDEDEELASEQRLKGSRSSNKSLFRNFNKICNKLMSRGSRSSSNTNSIGSASGSNIKGKPSNSPDYSSLESEVPELNSQPEVIVDLPSAPTVWPSETEVIPIQYMICVQNVAFRLRSSPTLKPAYYCRVPDCLFLFSNEIEGLENHFTRSHPSLRWNGSCTECSLPVKEVPDNLSIREELRHMVLVHVDEIVAPKPPEPAVEVAPPKPVLPKLRVRRFAGDRLVPEAEQVIEIEPEAVPREPVVENTTLRSLLLTQSRLPSHQQQQLNAAGVGEFLCAKTPPTTVDVPDVINRDSELGLQINDVYSLADTSIPLITGVTVPLPDDYVISQSLIQNYEGPIPTEINISIEPRLTGSPPRKDRTQIAGNRFRCMAPNCNYCSHTVMCIREHMKFHSFSFGPKDYLQCSYCSHVGKDVDEYVQHGVLQHGLASREELQEPNADEVELPISPAKLPVAGRQMVVKPLFQFVRKEVRYKCGVPDCGQHFDTELGLSQHLSTQHSCGDCFKCPHCHYVNHFLTLEKVLEHLKYHKRYVYQCGACRSFAPERSIIDHHIHIKHAKLGEDVDVIIHKRDDLTMHTKLAEVRWFKSLYQPRTSTDEWFCNLCHAVLATKHQMIGHTAVAHQRMYQYCCPYCEYGYKDLMKIVNHIRCSHASKRIQPLRCYLRIKCKNRQAGFICNTCHAATYTLYKMGNHCLQMHLNRFRYKCRHCDFGHTKHRPVAAHMTQEHPGLPGLPIQQFDRLSNDMLDDDFWNMAQIFSSKGHVEPPEAIASNNHAHAIQIFEPIELSSDEEDDLTNNAASAQKQYEFACSHCTETCHNIDELRSQHWAIKHLDHPFFFSVQPQLCCPVCYGFKGSAKALLEEHFPNVHHHRTLVACDVRQMRECGYCDKTYKEWPELVQHMTIEAHLANDLKNLTDGELNELIEMGSTENEYYQCNLCRVLLPSSVAIAQHGTVEHSDAEETFSFRLVKNTIIYHCSFCMYASVDELETLRHMLDHCKRFGTCHLCAEHLNSGFDEYIQHCYSSHCDQVDNFDVIHPYDDLKKFLMQVLYQFQNGLIISKSSLRDTRFSHERVIQQLYNELRSKAAKPPIPRMLFSQLPRIHQRRKTFNHNNLQQLLPQHQHQQLAARHVNKPNVIWHTSFTGKSNQSFPAEAAANPADFLDGRRSPQAAAHSATHRQATQHLCGPRPNVFSQTSLLGINIEP
ncbi:uncharacterized protein LOC117576581 isoform X2 [Drosophila albomicans]|uniref:Uncharacterized protein LOC117576581 isoform X2 n=1 Tax=Drosophila albomicans TaxID=7291 RepID=A0A9C6T1V8_DROAB|nr:uncharacterized protein LOC117576581 isoform X2 [Drosophila albomicans]